MLEHIPSDLTGEAALAWLYFHVPECQQALRCYAEVPDNFNRMETLKVFSKFKKCPRCEGSHFFTDSQLSLFLKTMLFR